MFTVLLSAVFISSASLASQDDPIIVEPECIIKAHDGRIFNTVFSNDQKTMLTMGGIGRPVLIWDLATKKRMQTFPGNVFWPQSTPSGTSFVGLFPRLDKERRASLWDVQECNIKTGETKVLYAATDPEQPIALWPDRKIAVTYVKTDGTEGGDEVLKFIDYDKMKVKRLVQLEPFTVLGFSPDKKLLALKYPKGKIKVFNWASSKKISEFVIGNEESFETLSYWFFAADSKSAYAAITFRNRRIEKWDLDKGKVIGSFKISHYLGGRDPTAITSDHRYVVSTSGRAILFINLETGAERRIGIKDAAKSSATAIGISPDGRKIAVGGDDGIVRILRTPEILP